MSQALAIPSTSLTPGPESYSEGCAVCGSTCLGSTWQGRKIGGSDTYKLILHHLKNWWISCGQLNLMVLSSRFSHVILTRLLQEVAFFGIIQSGHCMRKTHLRRLEVFALQGHVCQLRPDAWLV